MKRFGSVALSLLLSLALITLDSPASLSDEQIPEVTSFSISSSQIDTGIDSRDLTVSASITDESGIRYVNFLCMAGETEYVGFQVSPTSQSVRPSFNNNSGSVSKAFELVGDATSFSFTTTFEFRDHMADAECNWAYQGADVAGNIRFTWLDVSMRIYSSTGLGDIVGPKISNISAAPSLIDSGQNTEIRLSGRIQDNSGVENVWVRCEATETEWVAINFNPQSTTVRSSFYWGSMESSGHPITIVGDQYDFSYSVAFPTASGLKYGKCSWRVDARDTRGNITQLRTGSELSIINTSIVDNDAPYVQSLYAEQPLWGTVFRESRTVAISSSFRDATAIESVSLQFCGHELAGRFDGATFVQTSVTYNGANISGANSGGASDFWAASAYFNFEVPLDAPNESCEVTATLRDIRGNQGQITGLGPIDLTYEVIEEEAPTVSVADTSPPALVSVRVNKTSFSMGDRDTLSGTLELIDQTGFISAKLSFCGFSAQLNNGSSWTIDAQGLTSTNSSQDISIESDGRFKLVWNFEFLVTWPVSEFRCQAEVSAEDIPGNSVNGVLTGVILTNVPRPLSPEVSDTDEAESTALDPEIEQIQYQRAGSQLILRIDGEIGAIVSVFEDGEKLATVELTSATQVEVIEERVTGVLRFEFQAAEGAPEAQPVRDLLWFENYTLNSGVRDAAGVTRVTELANGNVPCANSDCDYVERTESKGEITKFICTGIHRESANFAERVRARQRAKEACELAKRSVSTSSRISFWYQSKATKAPSYVGKTLITVKGNNF